jgi:glycosyltransferase involved in cell wall biosynthesis
MPSQEQVSNSNSSHDVVVIVCVHNEADSLGETLQALEATFQGAELVVADDGSTDGSDAIAHSAGATVVRSERKLGKGGTATKAAKHMLKTRGITDDGSTKRRGPTFVLCDGDLGDSAKHLRPLATAVQAGEADLTVATFAKRVGGGFGWTVRLSRWAIQKRCGMVCDAPISGQRAMTSQALPKALPFAPGFGMETGMTIDVARAGLRIKEIELPLSHRATGKTLKGFIHRGRQFAHITAAYLKRR